MVDSHALLRGSMMSFQNERSGYRDLFALILILISGGSADPVQRQCAVIGFFFAVYFIRLISVRRSWIWGGGCVLAAFMMSFLSFILYTRIIHLILVKPVNYMQ